MVTIEESVASGGDRIPNPYIVYSPAHATMNAEGDPYWSTGAHASNSGGYCGYNEWNSNYDAPTAKLYFYGKEVVWLALTNTGQGYARVYIDDVPITDGDVALSGDTGGNKSGIDLWALGTGFKQAVYTKSWSTNGVHSIMIEATDDNYYVHNGYPQYQGNPTYCGIRLDAFQIDGFALDPDNPTVEETPFDQVYQKPIRRESVVRALNAPTLSLVVKDKFGDASHVIGNIYDLKTSYIDQGGPLDLTAIVPVNLITQKSRLFDSVSLYDGLNEIWMGRVRETPAITKDKKGVALTCEGWIKALTDETTRLHMLDTKLTNWSNMEIDEAGPITSGKFNLESKDRLMIGLQNGVDYITGERHGFLYEAPVPESPTPISRFKANYSCRYENAYFEASLWSYDGINGWQVLWALTASGAQSGSIDIDTNTTPAGYVIRAIPAVCTKLYLRVNCKADCSYGSGGEGDNYWNASFFDPVVYGHQPAGYTMGLVVQDLIQSSPNELSTDTAMISSSGFTVTDFLFTDPNTMLDKIGELNKFGHMIYGYWDRDITGKPRLTMNYPNDLAIDYMTTLNSSKPDLAGESIDYLYNAVSVKYNDINNKPQVVEVTSDDPLSILTQRSLLKMADPLSVNSTDSAAAEEAGEWFLADHNRPAAKGSLVIQGSVLGANGRRIPASWIKPGGNIMVRDLRISPASLQYLNPSGLSYIMNGVNIFRIKQVEVDFSNRTTTLQVDNETDRFEKFMSQKGW